MTATPIRGQITIGATCLAKSILSESLVLASVLAFLQIAMSLASRPYSHLLNIAFIIYESLQPLGPTLTLFPPNPYASMSSDHLT